MKHHLVLDNGNQLIEIICLKPRKIRANRACAVRLAVSSVAAVRDAAPRAMMELRMLQEHKYRWTNWEMPGG